MVLEITTATPRVFDTASDSTYSLPTHSLDYDVEPSTSYDEELQTPKTRLLTTLAHACMHLDEYHEITKTALRGLLAKQSSPSSTLTSSILGKMASVKGNDESRGSQIVKRMSLAVNPRASLSVVPGPKTVPGASVLESAVLSYCDLLTCGSLALTSEELYGYSKAHKWLKKSLERGGCAPPYRLALWRSLLKSEVLLNETVLEMVCRFENSSNPKSPQLPPSYCAPFVINERIDTWLLKSHKSSGRRIHSASECHRRRCCRTGGRDDRTDLSRSFESGCSQVQPFIDEYRKVVESWASEAQSAAGKHHSDESPMSELITQSGIAMKYMDTKSQKRNQSNILDSPLPEESLPILVEFDPCPSCVRFNGNRTTSGFHGRRDSGGSLPEDCESSSKVNSSFGSDSEPDIDHGGERSRGPPSGHLPCPAHIEMRCHHITTDCHIANEIGEAHGPSSQHKDDEVDYLSRSTPASILAGLAYPYDMPNPGFKEPPRVIPSGGVKDPLMLIPVQKTCSYVEADSSLQDIRLPAHWTDEFVIAQTADSPQPITQSPSSDELDDNLIRQDSAWFSLSNVKNSTDNPCICCRCCQPSAVDESSNSEVDTSLGKGELSDTRTSHQYSHLCGHYALGLWGSVGQWLLPPSFNSNFNKLGDYDNMLSPTYWHCHHRSASLNDLDLSTLKVLCIQDFSNFLDLPFTDEDVFEYLTDSAAISLSDALKEEIRRDISRTFPSIPAFVTNGGVGQTYLEKVLFAIAVSNPWVSYCQGLNFIAGTALIHTGCPVESYWIVMGMLRHLDTHLLFGPSVPLLKGRLHNFSTLFKDACPRLHVAFAHSGIEVSFIVQQWLMTMFAYIIHPSLLGHVWDVFFFSGWKAMHRCAISLILPIESHIWQTYTSSRHGLTIDPYDLISPMLSLNYQFRCSVNVGATLNRPPFKEMSTAELWNPLLTYEKDELRFRAAAGAGLAAMGRLMEPLFKIGNNIRVTNHCLMDLWLDRFHDELLLSLKPNADPFLTHFSGLLQHHDLKRPPSGVAGGGGARKSRPPRRSSVSPANFDALNLLKGLVVDPLMFSTKLEDSEREDTSKALPYEDSHQDLRHLLVWVDMQTISMRNWPLQECPRAYMSQTLRGGCSEQKQMESLTAASSPFGMVHSFLEENSTSIARDPNIASFSRSLTIHNDLRVKIRTQGSLMNQWLFVSPAYEEQKAADLIKLETSAERAPPSPRMPPSAGNGSTKERKSPMRWGALTNLMKPSRTPSSAKVHPLVPEDPSDRGPYSLEHTSGLCVGEGNHSAQLPALSSSSNISLSDLTPSTTSTVPIPKEELVTPKTLPTIVRKMLNMTIQDDSAEPMVPDTRSRLRDFPTRDLQKITPLLLNAEQLRLLLSPASLSGGMVFGRYFVVPLVALFDLISKIDKIEGSKDSESMPLNRWFTKHRRRMKRIVAQSDKRLATIQKLESEIETRNQKLISERESRRVSPSNTGASNNVGSVPTARALGALFRRTRGTTVPSCDPNAEEAGACKIDNDAKSSPWTWMISGKNSNVARDEKTVLLKTQLEKEKKSLEEYEKSLNSIRFEMNRKNTFWRRRVREMDNTKRHLIRNFLVRVAWTDKIPSVEWSPVNDLMSQESKYALKCGVLPNLATQIGLCETLLSTL
eukprot:GHVH01009979.1.p1 GENE.GHVH01009979.1~~GHVH01009979.1.p1  ORF type:complete len:1642 (+),score=227.08 GHVH01009979.1:2381-7306(+)